MTLRKLTVIMRTRMQYSDKMPTGFLTGCFSAR